MAISIVKPRGSELPGPHRIWGQAQPIDLGIPQRPRRIPEVELHEGLHVHCELAVLWQKREPHTVDG